MRTFYSSIKIDKAIDNNSALVSSYLQIGGILVNEHKYDVAKDTWMSTLILARKMGDKEGISFSIKIHPCILDYDIGDYKAAYLDYTNYIVYRDSLKNDETTKSMSEQIRI